jgi:hypothetical protein
MFAVLRQNGVNLFKLQLLIVLVLLQPSSCEWRGGGSVC